jgi:hypothetical protein
MGWRQLKDHLLEPFHPEGRVRLARQWEWTQSALRESCRQFIQLDLRFSHLAIAAMAVLGTLVNLFLPNGWTVWPLVLGASIMLIISEAADRNGQGVPPLQAYLLFFSATLIWLTCIAILQFLNPLILLVGILAIVYYAAQGYIKDLTHRRLIASRRADQLCIHCGEPADYESAMCLHCGREPDPDDARLKRVLHAPRSAAFKARTRENLTTKPPTADARRKEQALLARRRTKRPR